MDGEVEGKVEGVRLDMMESRVWVVHIHTERRLVSGDVRDKIRKGRRAHRMMIPKLLLVMKPEKTRRL